MTIINDNETWLVNPKGKTVHNAQLICLTLMKFKFRPNSKVSFDDRWKETGLSCRQDPDTELWGVICEFPDIEFQIREIYKTQEMLDDLWDICDED